MQYLADLLLYMGLANISAILIFHKSMEKDIAPIVFVNMAVIALWGLKYAN